ncbi:putative F-box domain, leucine-rich repeat domain superfamily [Helianthus annuus]|nr:putative F-box domain, leucine-rich repeat domain superfamily [Helianthus annuus]KAJ0472277.1 putative F-box domain, leucine-rich repeat domain superfamily [Helianthus annuus]KAJ0647876.1 putative F-box domain, leucine-rich repeat domain superfamily [Helianthus annuus]
MGQSSSTHAPPRSTHRHHRSSSFSTRSDIFSFIHSKPNNTIQTPIIISDQIIPTTIIDYTSEIPDECLALIFQFLTSTDRKHCSLVSSRWLLVEGQSRHRLALNAQADVLPLIPSIFSRFDSVTKLALRCDRRSVSVGDEGLVLISQRCPNLTRLKLRGCREVSAVGMSSVAKNCRFLKKFSCGSCMFGAKGINALLENSCSLEELSVKRLRDVNDGSAEPIGIGAAANSLKSVCLKELYNGQLFGSLICGAKRLKTLKLLRCLGDWDRLLTEVTDSDNCLVEVHLDRVQVSDVGLSSLSNCSKLEILHIVKTPECTNVGVVAVAEHCRYLRKLHIDGWRTNRIGNEGLLAIAKHSANLQELVLIGVNPNAVSLEAIATNCQKLERLALCGSETIADGEISCIASKCVALKKLCIKGCPVSDEGIEAFAWGCPKLVKIKVKKCKNVTCEVGDWLRARRGSLVVNLDVCEVETEVVDASASDGGVQEDAVEFPPIVSQPNPPPIRSNSTGNSRRTSIFKTRFGFLGGRGLVPCTFRRWSNGCKVLCIFVESELC